MSSLTTNCSETISSICESTSMRTWSFCMPMLGKERDAKCGQREIAPSMKSRIWRSVI